jgi:hypothetical protein
MQRMNVNDEVGMRKIRGAAHLRNWPEDNAAFFIVPL